MVPLRIGLGHRADGVETGYFGSTFILSGLLYGRLKTLELNELYKR